MPIYMKIEGTSGNASANNYKQWIELHSLNFGLQKNVAMLSGRDSDRQIGLAKFSEMEITKTADKSSTDLFQNACRSKVTPKIEIHVVSSGDNTSPYTKYVLSDVIISDSQTFAGKEGLPQERWLLNYTKIETTYNGHNEKHQAQAPMTAGFDLAACTVM